MERANLHFDVKGKATSGSHRKGESTEADSPRTASYLRCWSGLLNPQ